MVIALFLQHFPDLFFIYRFSCEVELKFVFAAAHAEYFKSVDLWNEFGRSGWHQFCVVLTEKLEFNCLPLGKHGGNLYRSRHRRCRVAFVAECRRLATWDRRPSRVMSISLLRRLLEARSNARIILVDSTRRTQA